MAGWRARGPPHQPPSPRSALPGAGRRNRSRDPGGGGEGWLPAPGASFRKPRALGGRHVRCGGGPSSPSAPLPRCLPCAKRRPGHALGSFGAWAWERWARGGAPGSPLATVGAARGQRALPGRGQEVLLALCPRDSSPPLAPGWAGKPPLVWRGGKAEFSPGAALGQSLPAWRRVFGSPQSSAKAVAFPHFIIGG